MCGRSNGRIGGEPTRIGVGLWVLPALLLIAAPAAGQSRSGEVFRDLFSVDDANGNVGSTGCGGGSGIDLSNELGDAAADGGVNDEDRAIDDRRDLFRYCDVTTADGANGWTSDDDISNGQIDTQSTAFAPEELFVGVEQSNAVFGVQIGNIATRIALLRVAARGPDAEPPVAFALHSPDERPPGGGPGERSGSVGSSTPLAHLALQQGINAGESTTGVAGLGAFVNGRVIIVDIDSNSRHQGSDTFGGGVTAGVDYAFLDNLVLGTSFGYTRLKTDFHDNSSDSDLNSYAFSLYGTFLPTEMIYVDGIFTGSIMRFDNKNPLPTWDSGTSFDTLHADADGWTIGGDVAFGMEIPVGPVNVDPHGRVSVVHTEFDSFKQKGGDGTLDLRIDDQEATSVTTSVGLGLSYPISTSIAVVSPYARAEWVHEYEEQEDDIKGHLVALPDAKFKLKASDTDRNYATVGGGVSATFGGGFSQFVDYDAVVGYEDIVVHQITAGFRLQF